MISSLFLSIDLDVFILFIDCALLRIKALHSRSPMKRLLPSLLSQSISKLISCIAAMALNPLPRNYVVRACIIQRPPKRLVFHRLS
jgi:hypothetical protein